MHFDLYTDGSCSVKDRIGGYAFVVVFEGEVVFTHKAKVLDTTNNAMELQAILDSMAYIFERGDTATIHSDSEYCIKSITVWRLTPAKKNYELIKSIHRLKSEDFKFVKVRAHMPDCTSDHNRFNNLADLLANEARLS